MTRSSTFPGSSEALLGMTVFPATEKTRSDLEEAAAAVIQIPSIKLLCIQLIAI